MKKNAIMKSLILFLLVLPLSLAQAQMAEEQATSFSLQSEVEKWKQEIPVKDLNTKWVNNIGNGDDSLYGVRNFRVVLYGVYYRGGANNYYHRDHPRSNMNPL